MSPPGSTATTARPVAHTSGERVTDLSTKSGQERYLVDELGVTYPQAKALLTAYAADLADADRLGNDTGRSDSDFLDWLMRQSPGQRPRSIRKWRVGEGGGWAVRS